VATLIFSFRTYKSAKDRSGKKSKSKKNKTKPKIKICPTLKICTKRRTNQKSRCFFLIDVINDFETRVTRETFKKRHADGGAKTVAGARAKRKKWCLRER